MNFLKYLPMILLAALACIFCKGEDFEDYD